MLKPIRSTLLAAGLVCVAIPAFASTIVLDPWTTPLPPNACLEDTHAEVIFSGPYCDGASCPPGTVRVGPCNGSNTIEFSQVPSSSFGTLLRYIDVQGPIMSGRVLPASQRMTVTNGDSPFWLVVLNYQLPLGTGYDLVAHGVDQLQFELLGTPGLAQPLQFDVFITGNSGQMVLTRTITEPGLMTLPLSEFTSPTGYTGTDVYEVAFDFSNCLQSDCTGVPPATAGGFSLGPISFHSTLPTPTGKRSWSQVKSIYR